jgi:superfamily II DNA/RNA helicase
LRITLNDGATVTADHVLTLLTRLQQIACGYVPVDAAWGADEDAEPQPVRQLFDAEENPRLAAIHRIVAREPQRPTLVWTRYHLDIDLLRAQFPSARVIDGRESQESRHASIEQFRAGHCPMLLCHPRAAARGLNLQTATRAIYYVNSFGLRRRLQSEDRSHRIGSSEPVDYYDIIGIPPDFDPAMRLALKRSVDWRVVSALRNNKSVADQLTGDPSLTDWL